MSPFSDGNVIDSKLRGSLLLLSAAAAQEEEPGGGVMEPAGSRASLGAPVVASSVITIAGVASFAKPTQRSPVSLSKKPEENNPFGCSGIEETLPDATSSI